MYTEEKPRDLFDELDDIVAREKRRRAVGLRDNGMAQAEANTDDWERKVIDQAIEHFAATGEVFSANTIRPLIPELKSPRVLGSRFLAASKRGLIRHVGFVVTDGAYGHAGHIKTWQGTRHTEQAAA